MSIMQTLRSARWQEQQIADVIHPVLMTHLTIWSIWPTTNWPIAISDRGNRDRNIISNDDSAEYFSEGATKFGVEDGVDDRVQETIDVAEPDEERKQPRIDVAELPSSEQVVAQADGVYDVNGKERHPAYQEDSCNNNNVPFSQPLCWEVISYSQRWPWVHF